MSNTLRFLVFCLLGLTATAFAGQYSADFPQFLSQNSGQQRVTAILSMADQVDLRALQDGLYAQHADRRAWHEAVVRALQEKATESQANLLAVLAGLSQSGQVSDYKSLWLGNLIIVTATPAAFDQLVTRDDILQINPDYPIEGISTVPYQSQNLDSIPVIAGHEIGATRLHVPEVWAMGFTGAGRLVSHLDTGVDGDHPAFVARWRGTADTRYVGHPQWAWFDPVTNTTVPQDWGRHGTHTMGTMCGRSTTTADTVGVAIDAQWISAGVIDRPNATIQQTMARALLALQWIADPDTNPATVWDVPDVCSNSWGIPTYYYPACDATFWTAIDDCEAAGCVVVFAAGNEGPGASSLRSPAARATTDINCFAVGAVDGANANLPIADFSARGPQNCTPNGTSAIKPEIVAPGVSVRSSVPGGGYESVDQYGQPWSGTSMATPHIAGIVALMRQANPNLTSEQVKNILLSTATDLGTAGNDNTYGMGAANALAAVQQALSLLSGWGTMVGTITDLGTSTPIQGAMISVVGRPWAAFSRANGQYTLYAPADTNWQILVSYPPVHFPVSDTVTLGASDTTTRDYALEGKIGVILKASFANAANVWYRSFFIKGTWDSLGYYDPNRSGARIEIKDDGVAPDQVSHDGIFTGRVYIGRDTVHTFNWSLYSENYGGEAALLQQGASFEVDSLLPPAIPTLAVNPSGSDNNWVISAVGDNGMSVDLVRNFGSVATKWGAACSLFTPNSYTFKFKVMHSDAASYGSGGIGGASLHITPPVSGSYVFVFDDATDSYYYLMNGTQGPPTTLAAVSNLDHHVTLTWRSPGVAAAGYNVYRDTLPFPFDRGLKVNSSIITAVNYDDHGGLQGHLTNGRTYYYQAAALYDVGGGLYAEAGPSNQTTAVPQNHAPIAAANVGATTINRNIHLKWHYVDDTGDLDHFTVERMTMPSGAWTEIGTTPDTVFTNAIAPGEDGVYGYRITVYDDGTPAMSSPPSGTAYAMVGHLPPTALTPTNGQEFKIPLHWSLPGSWGGARLINPDPPLILSNNEDNSIELFSRGGPDAAGYSWLDSDEPDGPAYQWRDITTIGQQIPMNLNDQNLGPYQLGFPFPFYGNTFSTFRVCSNGWISFTDSTHTYNANRTIPATTSAAYNMVAPFWDDLTFAEGGQLWYYTDGSECVISYIAVPHTTSGGPYTFQVILRNSGSILMQYDILSAPLNSATVGTQNATGTQGLQINYNADYLHSNMAILLHRAADGFEPAHFKLYRSLTSPVQLIPANLLAGSIPGTSGSYLDDDGIANGVPYHYAITAVWPDSTESAGSNETTGVATNYAPQPPANFVANALDRNISMHWSFTDLIGDFNHFNVYYRILPNGDWVRADSTADTLSTMTIPQGQDGVYEFAATAVDNGTPSLESGNSRTVVINIGHLAPTQLHAENDHSHAIPLSWMRPGTWLDIFSEDSGSPTQSAQKIPGDLPVTMGRGGPDIGGYSWLDSDEPDGPVFDWRNITTVGQQLPMNTNDQNIGPYQIGFSFPFYGNNFTTFRVCSNGWLSFSATTTNPTNAQLPSTSAPFNLVAPLWDDLTFAGGGQLWYYADGNECVISYINVPHAGTGGPYTFQIILRSSGSILFQYDSLSAPLNSATVGIQNANGTVGIQSNFNVDYLHNHMSILFRNASEGIPPDHYKLYRATSSPVPVDSLHLIASTISGTALSYVDSSSIVNGTRYYYVLTAVWPDSAESSPSNEANALPVNGAAMVINPTSLDITGHSGSIVLDTLNITNPGGLGLNWNAFAHVDLLLSIPDEGNEDGSSMQQPSTFARSGSGSEDYPVLFGRGGPDAYGYTWVDSDDPTGADFSWANIVGRGVACTLGNDANMGWVDMGFTFPFYGNMFDSLRICSNGWISFTSTSTSPTNIQLPSTSGPQNLIAPFWDDLNPANGGQIWYYTNSDSAVVSWINVPHQGTGGPYTMQVVLLASGGISFNYLDLTDPVNSATIGIQNASRTTALQMVCNQAYAHDSLSVSISHSWITPQPSVGTIGAGGNLNVVINCNAMALEVGTYGGLIMFNGQDQFHSLPQAVVPVTLHLLEPDAVSDDISILPDQYQLLQNYPNPFNPTTEIAFMLPARAHVTLEIYNLLGQRVRILVNSDLEAGLRSVVWNGADESGSTVTSGIYLYKLTANDKVIVRKMTLLK